MVFLSSDSGTFEAYVAPLDNPNDRIRLSRQGADHLRWRRDGREILWTTPQGGMMAAVVVTSPKLEIGEPRLLFTLPADTRGFDVATDGSRFILLVAKNAAAPSPPR